MTGSRSPTRYSADGARRSCCCRPGRSSRPLWKAQVPYLSRHYRVITFDGRGTGRSRRPGAGPTATPSSLRRARRAGRDRDRAAVLVGCPVERWAWRPRAPGAGARHRGDRPVVPDWPRRPRPRRVHVRRAGRTPRRAGRSTTGTTGSAAATTTSSEFFFEQMFSEPHSTKQIEDCVGWAHEIDPADARGHDGGPIGCDGAVCETRGAAAPGHVPGAGGPRRPRTASGRRVRRAAAELTGGELVRWRALGTVPPARDPVKVNHLIASSSTGSSRAERAARTVGAGDGRRPAATGAVPVVADRTRPRPAGPRDRERAARARPELRDRLARAAPGHPGARAAGERSTRRRRGCATSRPTSSTRPASTTCTRSRPSAGWTRSWCTTSWSSTRSWPTALRPGDRRRGVGRRLLPAREPRAQAVRVRVDDGLRRLAADARRRRARGRADGGLQRGDDRAAAPGSRGCGTASVFVGDPDDIVDRRFGPGLPEHPRLDRRELRLRRVRHRFDPVAVEGDPTRCGRARLRPRTSSSAWSPSAGPASERLCCAGSWTPSAGPPARPDSGSCSSPARGSTRVVAVGRGRRPRVRARPVTGSRRGDVAVVQGGLTTTMELTARTGRSSTCRCGTTSSRTSTWFGPCSGSSAPPWWRAS